FGSAAKTTLQCLVAKLKDVAKDFLGGVAQQALQEFVDAITSPDAQAKVAQVVGKLIDKVQNESLRTVLTSAVEGGLADAAEAFKKNVEDRRCVADFDELTKEKAKA